MGFKKLFKSKDDSQPGSSSSSGPNPSGAANNPYAANIPQDDPYAAPSFSSRSGSAQPPPPYEGGNSQGFRDEKTPSYTQSGGGGYGASQNRDRERGGRQDGNPYSNSGNDGYGGGNNSYGCGNNRYGDRNDRYGGGSSYGSGADASESYSAGGYGSQNRSQGQGNDHSRNNPQFQQHQARRDDRFQQGGSGSQSGFGQNRYGDAPPSDQRHGQNPSGISDRDRLMGRSSDSRAPPAGQQSYPERGMDQHRQMNRSPNPRGPQGAPPGGSDPDADKKRQRLFHSSKPNAAPSESSNDSQRPSDHSQDTNRQDLFHVQGHPSRYGPTGGTNPYGQSQEEEEHLTPEQLADRQIQGIVTETKQIRKATDDSMTRSLATIEQTRQNALATLEMLTDQGGRIGKIHTNLKEISAENDIAHGQTKELKKLDERFFMFGASQSKKELDARDHLNLLNKSEIQKSREARNKNIRDQEAYLNKYKIEASKPKAFENKGNKSVYLMEADEEDELMEESISRKEDQIGSGVRDLRQLALMVGDTLTIQNRDLSGMNKSADKATDGVDRNIQMLDRIGKK